MSMSIKADRWIREMCRTQRMIEPFEEKQVRKGVISFGVSSYGYDIRIADEFKIFTNVNTTIVDPKNLDPASMVDFRGPVCIIPPNSFALGRSVEYFRVPRNVLCTCLGKSSYARCFRGDTRVALVGGGSVALEDMAERSQRGEWFWGYSLGAYGRIIMSLLEAPRYIGRDPLLEIELDHGEKIHCTPDHGFILRNGRTTEAHDLRPGQSLMPLYRHLVRGCESVFQPRTGRLEPTHRLADAWNLRHQIYADRHHRDGNRRHDLPWNIERMPAGASLHRSRSANHKVVSVRELGGQHDVYCLTVPEAGNFALAAGVFVSNCGIITNVTPFEPEWEGFVTLEISNTTPLPAKIYANEGIAQVLFFEGDEVCEISYKDKAGKYQAQTGITLPRL
jgi:deoxycytidine triphosphate deaminase